MCGRESGLGGRLPLLTRSEVGPAGAPLLERYDRTWMPWARETPFRAQVDDGRYIGPFKEVEMAKSTLDARVRQIVILSVGAIWGTPYELYAHAAAARKAGLTGSEIDRLVKGIPCASLSETEAVAQAITLELVRERALTDETYRSARVFGPSGLADLVLLAGCYLVVCSLLNAFAIPAPDT